MPFLAEHLWRNLVSADESVFLAPWPEPGEVDDTLLAEVAEVRRVVELGRQARAASGLKLRQPLRRLVVAGASLRAPARGRDRRGAAREGRRVRRGRRERAAREAEPARPRPEARRRAARRARRAAGGRSRRSTTAASAWTGTCSSRTRCSWSASARRAGRSRADEGLTVALDTALDDELRRERRVLDLIHQVNAMRREAGLELTDRIRLWIPDDRPARLRGAHQGGDARRERRAPASSGSRRPELRHAAVRRNLARLQARCCGSSLGQ